MQTVSAHGLTMPALGLGTWQMRGAECTASVLSALSLGYRHIDTAKMYGNEAAIGAALAETDVERGELHLTTKVWPDSLAPAALRRSLETSLADLRTGYVDLLLIHWPHPEMDLPAALETMMRLREEGLTRHIGVSNFSTALMRQAIEEIGAPIVCNQIEYHALLDRSTVIAYARSKGLIVTAYCPLARGRLAEQPALEAIAHKHGASAGQVGLRWLLDQDGIAAVPKASQPANQKANLAALDLRLDAADRAEIAALPKDIRLVSPGFPIDWD